MQWQAPPKPTELAESRLVEAILDGQFLPHSNLPPERELAALLGVTRPTLREVLQRLARDGWIEIHHGRPTRVRDIWREGSLGVLSAIAHHSRHQPPDFIPNLLTIRRLLAPTYTQLAVQNSPEKISAALHSMLALPDTPLAFTQADFDLHCLLTIESRNPIFTLILNGFRELYLEMGQRYFSLPQARRASHDFYFHLHNAATERQPALAAQITRQMMDSSLEFWNLANQSGG